MEHTGAKLLIRFTDPSPSFTYGVEFGRMLQQFEDGASVIGNHGFPVRVENVEVLRQACKEYNYIPYFGNQYYGEWVEFFAVKNGCNRHN